MAYKKDQGRYARMVAFWCLFLLIAYGCMRSGGLVTILSRDVLGSSNVEFIRPFPLIDVLDLARVICIGVLALAAFVLYKLLNKPQAADMLIETEGEMKKVTWPSMADTWSGTIAVVLTVLLLFAFLTGANFLLGYVLRQVMG